MEINSILKPVDYKVIDNSTKYEGYLNLYPEMIIQTNPSIKIRVKHFIEVTQQKRKHKETGKKKTFIVYDITDFDEIYYYVNDIEITNVQNFRKNLVDQGFSKFANEAVEYCSIPKELIKKSMNDFVLQNEQVSNLFGKLPLFNSLTKEEKQNWEYDNN